MVCHGPDPPENNPYELVPPPRHDLTVGTFEDSDDDNEYIDYEPLPQGPEAVLSELSEHDSDDETENTNVSPTNAVPPIESMEIALTRDVWTAPRPMDPIEMDNERAQQVMTAMANFALPQTSIPEWAQSITEDQWKQTLNDRIEKLKNNL